MNRVYSAIMVCCLLGLHPLEGRAQEDVLAEIYGQGVHAYFACNFVRAHDLLTMAIDQGSNDPRAYFFRGLAYTRLGRMDEALMDFKVGANLEINNPDRIYPVADSLQRVQGGVRMLIERERQLARLSARATRTAPSRAEDVRRAEEDAVRQPGRRPAVPPAAVPGAPGAPGADLFGEESAPVPAPPRPKPAIAAPPEAEDPFGDKPATPPAAKPAEAEDPFGTTPAPAAPAAEPDPFGTPPAKPADTSDPFSDDAPAAKPADTSDPFAM